MAVSNRDRVSKGLEMLAEGLSPFVDRAMTTYIDGGDWIGYLKKKDLTKFGNSKNLEMTDVAVQLRTITEERPAFKELLSQPEAAFASELREVRNRWAHNEAFSADDTYRALDTMERLLTAVGASVQSETVKKLRQDFQRTSLDADERRAARSQADQIQSFSVSGLKPWREVLKPHQDVATGNYSASEFAADLQSVSQNEGSVEYVDPVEFFRRTFLTTGLRDIMNWSIDRISGDPGANPVINLQTNFGGGKTHSMLALWHLFSGTPSHSFPQEVQELIGTRILPQNVHRVALVGTHLSAVATTKSDGTVVKTIWGELAYQLGGKEAFELVAESDEKGGSPGDELKSLVKQFGPCLILIDEWVAYARQLWGREDLDAGTFDTQFSFAQTLTEVAKTVPGTFLVISIPASHDPDRMGGSQGSALEVGGPNGQEALKRLQNVVRRVADPWNPASSSESFEIVKRRLFEEPSAAALMDISLTARKFGDFYKNQPSEFPSEASQQGYESRIKAAYPIHPELFDRLYEDWSTLERFQRTRGVLRLMSSVVHELWVKQDASPLILPSSVPLEAIKVASELTQYLPDSWKAIVDTDIAGNSSTPAEIDRDRPLLGQRAVTQRVATTIFIDATPTLQSSHKGVERSRVLLGSAIPGDVIGNFSSAIDQLSQKASYFYSDGNRYWFDTQPSVGRKVADYAEALRDRLEDVRFEITERLRASESRFRGSFAGIQIAPLGSADIPDAEDARLAVLSPQFSHTRNDESSPAMKFAVDASEHRGSAQRTNRNMIIFLAPDEKRLEEAIDAMRQFMGWRWMAGRFEEENLSPSSQRQIEVNLERSASDVDRRISDSYTWIFAPVQPDPQGPVQITVEKADGSQDRLAERVSDRLLRTGMLFTQIHPRNIRMELESKLKTVWGSGYISVGELWSYFCKFPYLTRLRDRSVLIDGVRSAISLLTAEIDGFALAERFDAGSGAFTGVTVPSGEAIFGQILDSTLLVDLQFAKAREMGKPTETAEGESDSLNATTGAAKVLKVDQKKKTRFFGTVVLDSERHARDFARLSQEIISQILSIEGSKLEVIVEIQAELKDGFSDEAVRIISENARTLRFSQQSFEES